MNLEKSSSTNPSGVQGICPTGWHLPSDVEWTELNNYLGGATSAGAKLKETGTAHWELTSAGVTNETGFTALPGGYRVISSRFSDIGISGNWWSATENNESSAWLSVLNCTNYKTDRQFFSKEMGYSVRCLRD